MATARPVAIPFHTAQAKPNHTRFKGQSEPPSLSDLLIYGAFDLRAWPMGVVA